MGVSLWCFWCPYRVSIIPKRFGCYITRQLYVNRLHVIPERLENPVQLVSGGFGVLQYRLGTCYIFEDVPLKLIIIYRMVERHVVSLRYTWRSTNDYHGTVFGVSASYRVAYL